MLGALALLTGWSQFSVRFRNKHLYWHRTLGKVYLISVLLCGAAGLLIEFCATGEVVAITGFTGLAIGWAFNIPSGYLAIPRKEINQHQYWMIRSYALCFAAVTLRIWLPLFQFGFNFDFFMAYRIIAWLCWGPNLVVAEIIISNLKASRVPSKVISFSYSCLVQVFLDEKR